MAYFWQQGTRDKIQKNLVPSKVAAQFQLDANFTNQEYYNELLKRVKGWEISEKDTSTDFQDCKAQPLDINSTKSVKTDWK